MGAAVRAAAPARGKSQGFAKKAGTSSGFTRKKISPGSLYKNWTDTVHTARLNSNAVNLNLPIMKSQDISENLNKVTYFADTTYKTLHHLGSFRKDQRNELFPKPISLVRESTTKKLIDELKNGTSKKLIITGEPGVGKSVLLSQVHAYGLESNMLLINISYPESFLNGRNDFMFDESLKLYTQPMYTKELIRKILKANKPEVLEKIPLTKNYKFTGANSKDSGHTATIQLKEGQHTLSNLLSVKANPQNVGIQFQAVMEELLAQEKVPVLFTIDNFSRFLTKAYTDYRNVKNQQIYSLQFQLGKTIMDIISGDSRFKNKRSAFVAAISGVDRTNRTLPVGLGKLEEDPYVTRYHYEKKFADLLKRGKVEEFEVPKWSKEEIGTLINFYRDSGIISGKELDSKTPEQYTDEKYFVSGNGNPRELLKSIALSYR